MPHKRIALFLDGTWNTAKDDTNVWRMKSLCASDPNQVCYYSVGVGAGVGISFGQHILGGMFGRGIDKEVLQAYKWLVENYNHGDQIYIFGFSRGAFTARSLSGLISKCGLLKRGAPLSLSQLYSRYRKGSAAPTIRELNHIAEHDQSFEDRWIIEYSIPISIWLIGVWDTVGALGIPFGKLPFSRSKYQFLDTDLRIENDRAYHALAIDEHRAAFKPTLWTKMVPKSATPGSVYPDRPLNKVEQRWFVGAHSNVGGGYNSDLLPQIPLRWLMQKAAIHGLTFADEVVIDGDENRAPIHDSFAEMANGIYWALELGRPYYRPIGADPTESKGQITKTINETIDPSVFDRWRNDPSYRPENLVIWARKMNIDIASLDKAVRADDPTVVVPSDNVVPS